MEEPTHGWGKVSHSSVGVVTRMVDDGEMKIDFPEQEDWIGQLEEMELVTNGTGKL